MAQTNGYGFTLAKAQAGQKVDLINDIVDSFAAEGAVPYGRGVIRGTAENQAELADSAVGDLLGVSVFTHANEQALAGGAEYRNGDTVSVLAFGRVWMEVVGEATAGAPAYIIVAAGENRGKATATAASNLGPVGRFLASGEDEILQIEITKALQGPQGPQGDPG